MGPSLSPSGAGGWESEYFAWGPAEALAGTTGRKPQGQTKFLKKYAAFTLLVIDEWLQDHPDEAMRSMLLELLERR